MNIIKETAPHIRKKSSVTRMMVDVLIALAPTLIFAIVVYPLQAIYTLLISLFVMNGAEFVGVGLRNLMPRDDQKHSFKERFEYAYKGKFGISNVLTASISAVIYTLILPPGAPIYAIIIGALVGITFGKLVFGGLGSNIFNPAAVGMVFTKLCFGSQYQSVSTWYYTVPDVAAGATPLGLLNGGMLDNITQYSLRSLILGQIPGTLGEVYKITIVIGLAYLLIRRSADYRIVVSYLGICTLLSLIAGLSVYSLNNAVSPIRFTAYYMLSGGILFGAAFMLTDPVTSPINSPSRLIYGLVAGVLTMFIRLFAALPEGVAFSILISNMIAVALDHYEWSTSKYNWKNLLTMGLLVVIPVLLVWIIISLGGVYNGQL